MATRTGDALTNLLKAAEPLMKGVQDVGKRWGGIAKDAAVGTTGLGSKARGLAGGAVGVVDKIGAASTTMVNNTVTTAGNLMQRFPTLSGLLIGWGIYKAIRNWFSKRGDKQTLQATQAANALMAQQMANMGMAQGGQAAQMARYNTIQNVVGVPTGTGPKRFTDTVRGIFTGNRLSQ